MNLRQIENQRRDIYRATPALKICTMREAARWIDRIGFAWLFASTTAPELPSLFEAVKGRRGAQIDEWDRDADMIWVWKNDLPAQKRAYYGKALCGRPTCISLKMLPYLYAHAGEDEFERVYARGAISYEAKRVYEALARSGPQPTMALRRAAGLDSRAGQARYHRALDELQRRLYVLPIGATNETGAWPSQIFELVARWFPHVVATARQLDQRQARRMLAKKYVQTVLAAKPAWVARVFRFTREELKETLADLVASRALKIEGDWIYAR